jgi:hypothetical protein
MESGYNHHSEAVFEDQKPRSLDELFTMPEAKAIIAGYA